MKSKWKSFTINYLNLRMKIKQSIIKYSFDWLSAIMQFVFFFPLVFMPNHALFLIHDNLDGIVPLFTFLGNSSSYWSSGNTIVEGIMGGVPRATLPSAYNFLSFCFYLFPPLIAYIVHYIIQHLIAFIGMRLFIKSTITKNRLIFNGVALAFSFLPFYPGASLTVAGLPILAWAMVSIFKGNNRFTQWIVIIVFPFFSSIPFGNLFSFPVLFILAILGIFYKHWKLSFRLFLPFVVLGIVSIFIDFQLIELLLSGFESNRMDTVVSSNTLNFKGIIGVTGLAFLFGHYHFHSLHIFIALLVFVIGIWTLFKKGILVSVKLFIIPIIILILCFLTIYISNKQDLLNARVNIRFWAFFPFLWYGLLAYTLSIIHSEILKKCFLFFQVIWVMFLVYPKDYFGSSDAENVFANTWIYKKNEGYLSFDKYYKTEAFKQLSIQYPEIKKSNSVCLGFVPGIALFNGYKTFDAYLNVYPKEKWENWKLINSEEYVLAGNKNLFSNKAFLYSSEYEKNNIIKSAPKWNLTELRKVNVKYIISTIDIPIYEKVAVIGSIHVFKI